jgi:hypothetical protein
MSNLRRRCRSYVLASREHKITSEARTACRTACRAEPVTADRRTRRTVAPAAACPTALATMRRRGNHRHHDPRDAA